MNHPTNKNKNKKFRNNRDSNLILSLIKHFKTSIPQNSQFNTSTMIIKYKKTSIKKQNP